MHAFNVVRAHKLLVDRDRMIIDYEASRPKDKDKEEKLSRSQPSMYEVVSIPKELAARCIAQIEEELTFLGVVFEPAKINAEVDDG